jgi:glycosyltransferase involved in cell wall biosynthesis
VPTAPILSVVIPTHKRPAILSACLEHLERQTVADRIEAVVVSDGHDPATVEAVTGRTWTVPVTFREIPKAQQGAARNEGVRHAKGEIVLFLGDDILLAPGACEAHLEAHARREKIAVLGRIDWDPSVGITATMRWLDQTGWQFGFAFLERYAGQRVPEDVQHAFTYASNLSMPAGVARATPFPEGVTEYGWEDVVFGMELRKKGVGLLYQPAARALHRHRIELADSLRRMRAIGKTAELFARRDPAFDRRPRGWKLAAYRVLALLPTIRGLHAKALLDGMRSAH